MSERPNPNDPELIENILAEVKRSGMFDQFRKDCISDVDTKPAYQNLQFKVENTVSSFLSNQKWTPDMNRNQLRDKLRKNILDTNYLDTGIERIVDQVLHPKMPSFQSQIEDLVYSYLKIDRPKRKNIKTEKISDKYNASLLPNDLEAVSSPESDKHEKFMSGSMEDLDKEDNDDDFESPAFEPLVGVKEIIRKKDDDSHLSGLSGLTSEGSPEREHKPDKNMIPPIKFDVLENVKQEEESQLSEVSSGSRLSIVMQSEKDSKSPKPDILDITEEAQMPKFNENSNSVDTKEKLAVGEQKSIFDFKKEEIEFKGPGRKPMTLDEKLKEEIFESENKHSSTFKLEENDTNSQSSDIKLEIVEHSQQYTESSSAIKMEGESVKYEEEIQLEQKKITNKNDSPSHSKEKKERSASSSHHKSSKYKHSYRNKEDDKHDRRRHGSEHDKRSSSKYSSSHHSKSRHSDKERSSSSSQRHKSSHHSSSKDKERYSSRDHKSSSKDKYRDKDRMKERSKEEKYGHEKDDRQKFEEHSSQEKQETPIEYSKELLSGQNNEKKLQDGEELVPNRQMQEHELKHDSSVDYSKPNTPEPQIAATDYAREHQNVVEDISTIENLTQSDKYTGDDEHIFPETDAISDYQEEYHGAHVQASSCQDSSAVEKNISEIPTTISTTTIVQDAVSDHQNTPPKLDFMSDEDDFLGFPESESSAPFATPLKRSTSRSVTPKQPQSLKRSMTNRSIVDEDSFYGFEDMSPAKVSQKISSQEAGTADISQLPVKDIERPPTPDINLEECDEKQEHDNIFDQFSSTSPETSETPTTSEKKSKKLSRKHKKSVSDEDDSGVKRNKLTKDRSTESSQPDSETNVAEETKKKNTKKIEKKESKLRSRRR